MQYLLLIYEAEANRAGLSEEEAGGIMHEYNDFGEEAGKAGVVRGGEALEPVASATTVRVRDGERLLTDGPFAETKEQLGGFYLVECETLDEAIDWAAKIPGARTGAVEVRPIMIFPSPDQAGSAG